LWLLLQYTVLLLQLQPTVKQDPMHSRGLAFANALAASAVAAGTLAVTRYHLMLLQLLLLLWCLWWVDVLTPLDHKALDVPMKDDSIVVIASTQR
jgi:hypothetical protein